MSRDTGCRPHELLKLRITDIVFKNAGVIYLLAPLIIAIVIIAAGYFIYRGYKARSSWT